MSFVTLSRPLNPTPRAGLSPTPAGSISATRGSTARIHGQAKCPLFHGIRDAQGVFRSTLGVEKDTKGPEKTK